MDNGETVRHTASAGTCRRRSLGQSLVEFALVLPILLFLILATVDFGRVYLGYVSLQNLARIAANVAANNPTTDWANASNTDPIVSTYNTLIADDSSTSNCAMQPDVGTHNPPRPTLSGTSLGDSATVQLTCRFTLFTPIIRDVFGGSGTIPVSAKAVFPVKTGAVAGIGVVGGGGPQIPQAAFTGSPTSGTASLTVTFSDQSTNAPTSWAWTFGDSGSGSNISTLQNPSHTYAVAGTYSVTLTVTNADGSTTLTKSGYIVVGAANAANFSGTPLTGAAPLAVAFTDLSTGATSWAWNFGDGGTSTAQNPSHTYASAGTYTVSLTINGGPLIETKTGYVTVTAPQCTVPNVSDGGTKKSGATTTLQDAGFVVVAIGSSPPADWNVRVQSPQGGLSVTCGSTVTIYK